MLFSPFLVFRAISLHCGAEAFAASYTSGWKHNAAFVMKNRNTVTTFPSHTVTKGSTSLHAINVQIKANAEDKLASAITASGKQIKPLQDVIGSADLFGLGPSDSPILKNAVNQYFGALPTNAYLGPPTPWNLYPSYGWEQVNLVMEPISAEVIGITSEPVIVASKTYSNESSSKVTVTATLTDKVTQSATTSWSKSSSYSVGEKITVKVGFEGIADVSSETSFSFSDTTGTGGSNTKTTELSTSTGVNVDLEPGKKVKVDLAAFRGQLKCRVHYRQYLTGQVAANYKKTYQGHYFWALYVGSLVTAVGKKQNIELSEELDVDFFSNTSLVVSDLESGAMISKINIGNDWPIPHEEVGSVPDEEVGSKGTFPFPDNQM